ncbi:FecCD family ABC transporter permease [Piscicoccus intestinalis]|uniref:FecCD family ABC transporter permease n=1 Tax=Piscicoccus intestinalis TaxID=746033 RepID=UPI000837DB22|nr:iron ABC transporter permease [Piscicoccus intestinalis]
MTSSTRVRPPTHPDGSTGAPTPRRAPHARRRLVAASLLAATLSGLVVLHLSLGETWLPPSEVAASLLGQSASGGTDFLVRELRGPRVVGALVVGACLGASGAITQSLLRNPLASPDIIGVTAGASCLAVAALLAAGAVSFAGVGSVGVPLLACLGGAIAGVLVVALAWRGGLDARRVVLVGLGVNAGLSALTSWLLLRADLPDLTAAMTWLTGSLAAVDAGTLRPAGAGALACLALALLGSERLGLLRFGDATVRSLGVNVPVSQLIQAVLAVVAASLACAVAGPVAFVAFCAPQIAMVLFRTQGPPVAGGMLVGAAIMVGADIAARVAFPTPVPVGLVTAFCGAPVLLWLLTRLGRSA